MRPMPLRQKRLLVGFVSLLLGFALWYLSPQLFHHREPWDGNILHYGAALVTIGFALRILLNALPMSVYFGVLAGQFLGLLWPDFVLASLLPLGAILIFLFSLFAYLGTWLGQYIR